MMNRQGSLTLTRDFSFDQLQTIRSFFTDGEWDTIANALEDYRHYDDEDLQEDELIEGRSQFMDRIAMKLMTVSPNYLRGLSNDI